MIIGKKTMADFEGAIQKFVRSFTSRLFGLEYAKQRLLPDLENAMRDSFAEWAARPSIEAQDGAADVMFDLVGEKMIGIDRSTSRELRKNYSAFLSGLLCVPIYFPGTTFYRCMQEEHEALLKNRKDVNSGFTWEEYKSLTFTTPVTNELLRMINVSPGIFRQALTDVQVNESGDAEGEPQDSEQEPENTEQGYTIPAGWMVMMSPMAVHLNDEYFEDPLSFNPWRWLDESKRNTMLTNFMPFGLGIRTCPALEFIKVFVALFLHIMVTKYRWKVIKGGEVSRKPVIMFPQGCQIKLHPRT